MKKTIEKIKNAEHVFICGNGGSAAAAEHFTVDLLSRGIKAFCLNSNVSIMTMIANDYGYEYVFSNQLDVLAREKDLLITISCSGTSLNILEAHKSANLIGMKIVKFETFTDDSDYGLLEDKHLKLIHEIAKRL